MLVTIELFDRFTALDAFGPYQAGSTGTAPRAIADALRARRDSILT